MAFVLKQSDDYTWPVTIETPENGGRITKSTFDAQFKRIPQTRINELVQLAKENILSDHDVCTEILCGWSGVSDGTGDLPYSEAAKAQLLDVPGVQPGILAAWFESLSGGKRKN